MNFQSEFYSGRLVAACHTDPRCGRMTVHYILVLFVWQLAASGGLYAQRVSVGVEAGVPVTESFDTGFIYRGGFLPATERYTIGPVLDLRLAGPFSIRFNALYQPYSFRLSSSIGTPSSSKTTGSLWQFPVLLKYQFFEGGAIQPFIAAGPSVQVATNGTTTTIFADGSTRLDHSGPERQAIVGLMAGGGFIFAFSRVHISPEVRYTRWGQENFDFTQTDHVGTKLNQVQVLVAVTF